MTAALQIDFLLAGYRHPTTDEFLAGGKVKTYLDGTSTLSALWTDKDKGGVATNPIILDSAGKAEVYGDNIYKFEIYDSDDVLIETITGLEYIVRSQLSLTEVLSDYDCNFATAVAAIGSVNETHLIVDCEPVALTDGQSVIITDNIALEWRNGYVIDGTAGGSTETLTINGALIAGSFKLFGDNITIAGTFDPDVKWWGVAMDGVTDDTTNFNRVIAFMEQKAGGTLSLPPGELIVDALDFADSKYNSVKGAGMQATKISIQNTSGTGWRVRADFIEYSDFTLNGPSSGTGDGMYLKETSGPGPKLVSLKNINILNFTGGVGLINDGFANNYEKLFIHVNNIGYRDDGGGGHVRFKDSFISFNTTYGIQVAGPLVQMQLDSTNIEANDIGIFSGGASAGVDNLLLNSCHFEGNLTQDVRMGIGTTDCIFNGGRLAGTNSLITNSISHTGGVGSYRITLNGVKFIDDASASNTEVIDLGDGVELIIPSQEGKIDGLERANISLTSSAFITIPGVIGNLADSVNVSGVVTIDFEAASFVNLTLVGDITNMATPANLITGKIYAIRFRQDATGGWTVTFGSNYKNAPTIRTTASGTQTVGWLALDEDTLEYLE